MILFPEKIQIETTVICPSKCNFCPNKEMKRSPVYMQDQVWKKIIDETRGRGIIYRPFLINEPFMDERMPEIIRYIKQDKTAKVEFNSNGNLRDTIKIKDLMGAGIDWLRFSIDAFSQDAFAKTGRSGDIEKIKRNVIKFIEEKARLKSDCVIEVRMIDMESTKHEQKDFIEFWGQYADKVTFTSSYTWPWSGQTEPYFAPCPKIRKEMFFMTNGNAVLCCWDAFGRSVIGNIQNNTVEEIWLGETNQRYREYLDKGERDKIKLCSRCNAFSKYDFSNWEGY